jgi:amino-acid N-acetyltransferase
MHLQAAKPGEMRVRPAYSGDWAVIGRLLQLAGIPDEDALDGAEFFVAEQDGMLAGCVGLELFQDSALLRSLAVLRGLERQGLGEKLVRAALESARATGVSHIVLLAGDSQGYFARFGFEPVALERVAAAVRQSPQFACRERDAAQAMMLELTTSSGRAPRATLLREDA